MKKIITRLCLFLFIIGFLPKHARADRAAAGEIIYEWISDSTYRFFLKYHNNCGGQPADSTQTLCLYNSCTDSAYSVPMPMWVQTLIPGPQPTPPLPCALSKTTCDSAASHYVGYKELWYSAIVKLPSRCSLWKFSVSIFSRSSSVNLNTSANNNLYLETTMNNAQFQGNSSVYCVIDPTAVVCAGAPYEYNSGAIDPNRDSVVTEIVPVLTRDTFCEEPASAIGFATGIGPALSVPGNPFQTNNTLNVNPRTGQISFRAATLGINTFAIRISEYRNGVFKGSVMRNIALQVMECDLDTAVVSLDTPTLTGGSLVNGSIELCPGQKLEFCWNIEGTDPTTVFVGSDNHTQVMPGSNVVYMGQKKDSVRGCLSWQSSVNDKGVKEFVMIAKDSTCRPPGIMHYYTRTIPIRVWGPIAVSNDTFICQGQQIRLNVKHGDNYTWSVISGTPGSLNCYTCDTVMANPNQTTSYSVVSSASTACGSNTDTVTVTVWPVVTPMINIGAVSTNIAVGQTAYFYCYGVTCDIPAYQWKINGITIPDADSNFFAYSGFNDRDTVTCDLACSDVCATSPTAASNRVIMRVKPISITDVFTGSFKLYPNPNKGVFTIEGNVSGRDLSVIVTNTLGQIVYSQTLNIKDNRVLTRQLDMGEVPAGIYMVTIKTDDGLFVQKLHIRK